MVEHGLKPHADADRLKDVKDILLHAMPEVEQMDPSLAGTAWREAKKGFKVLKSQDTSHDVPLEVTEVVPEGLQGALGI
jgi:hypothetical protein